MGFGKDDFLVSITEASISAALQKSRLNVKCICFVLTLTVVFWHIYTCLHARTRTHVGLLRTPREQNYALVTFKDVEDAQQALYALMAHGHADWVLDFEPLDVSESLFSSIPVSPPPASSLRHSLSACLLIRATYRNMSCRMRLVENDCARRKSQTSSFYISGTSACAVSARKRSARSNQPGGQVNAGWRGGQGKTSDTEGA